MSQNSNKISLTKLSFYPYVDDNGLIKEDLEGKIGVYAIFNQDKILEYVGYSRNLLLSLKQNLVRQPEKCYWFKTYIIERPSRSILEEIKQSWLSDNGAIPSGNDGEETKWTQPIDAKLSMTQQDKQDYEFSDELGRIKLLKKVSRRVEEEVKNQLKARHIQFEIRFNPKLKEEGLLDLK